MKKQFRSCGFCLALFSIISTQSNGAENTPKETAFSQSSHNLLGEGLSDAQFLDRIDLSLPGLEKVRKLAASEDWSGAMKALASYYRTRKNVRWWYDPFRKIPTGQTFNSASADQVVSGLLIHGVHRYQFPDSQIVWDFNPTEGKPNATNEWVWHHNRMYFWEDLGVAWERTGNPKYADTFVKHLRSWAKAMPMPKGPAEFSGSGWRGLEAGVRASETWPQAWFHFLSAPVFTDDDLLLMARLLHDHGRFLNAHPLPDRNVPISNHYMFAMSGLYVTGALFPEFKEASQWRAKAISELDHGLSKGQLQDGAWYELSPGYHLWVMDRMADIYKMAVLQGLSKELPSNFLARIQQGLEWAVQIAAPDGTLPMLNDTSRQSLQNCFKPEVARIFPESRLIAWASDWKQRQFKIQNPLPHILFLSDSGLSIIRTGFDNRSHYLCMDSGPLGGWHGHQDKLGILLWVYGREMLFDGGGGTYDTSAFRKYATATASHSTVLVDGEGQSRTWTKKEAMGVKEAGTPVTTFSHHSGVDYTAGWYVGNYGKNKSLSHRREVALVQKRYFALVDTLVPTDSAIHKYEARWQIKTTNWRRDGVTQATVTTDNGLANLAIVPLKTAPLTVYEDSGVKGPELLGWNVERDKPPKPALTVRHQIEGAGIQRFVTFLFPIDSGADNPVQAVSEQPDASWVITLRDSNRISVSVPKGEEGGFTITESSRAGDSRVFRVGVGTN